MIAGEHAYLNERDEVYVDAALRVQACGARELRLGPGASSACQQRLEQAPLSTGSKEPIANA